MSIQGAIADRRSGLLLELTRNEAREAEAERRGEERCECRRCRAHNFARRRRFGFVGRCCTCGSEDLGPII